jgi:hypothetical protein
MGECRISGAGCGGDSSVKTERAGSLDQVDTFELGLRSSGFFPQLCHWLAVWLWVSHLHFLCHPFPFVKQTKLKPNLQKSEEGYLPCRIRQGKIWPFASIFCANASSDLLWQISEWVLQNVAFPSLPAPSFLVTGKPSVLLLGCNRDGLSTWDRNLAVVSQDERFELMGPQTCVSRIF